MSFDIIVLTGTAISIGFIHTITGPDHYIPFIVLSKVKEWSKLKTAIITTICGIGHILSSILLGFIGIFLGIAIFKLEKVESFRGEIAAWLLLIFGFTYFIWGIWRAGKKKTHTHFHYHDDSKEHIHKHNHLNEHPHIHLEKKENLTPWVLFIIFVFGPCEPLIPLFMYPAAKGELLQAYTVALFFGATTILTMLSIVFLSLYGLSRFPLKKFERYSHAMAGLAIFFCGAAIKFLGL